MKNILNILTIAAIVMMLALPFSFAVRTVQAQSSNYSITGVKHTVTVFYNGYVFIDDFVQMSGSTDELLIGFPYEYGPSVIRCIAYNSSEDFPVTMNVPLEDHIGFYAVKVVFPHGTPQRVNVGFVLSNSLLTQDTSNVSKFSLDFPTYPSLPKPVATCNGSVVTPSGAVYLSGSVNAFTYSTKNLTAFNYASGNVTFLLTENKIRKFDMKEMNREISVNEAGEIVCSDTYRVVNKAPTGLDFVDVFLLANSSNPTAQDQFGRGLSNPLRIDEKTNRYKVTFAAVVQNGESTMFTVRYDLTSSVYLAKQEGTNRLDLNFTLFGNINGYAEKTSTSFVLPEGAKVTGLRNIAVDRSYSLSKNVFQESVAIGKENVISLDSVNVGVTYEYNSLWLSFRPTLWMWALTLVGCAIALVWNRPKTLPKTAVTRVTTKLSLESIKAFVDAYEEKMKILSELSVIEDRAEKGKIPRRRYKVQKKTLETRLGTLSRNLADLKDALRSGGGHYSELMLQLEVAESELNEVRSNIKNAEAMHNRGELVLEVYRKRLTDYEHRKHDAESTINGILLRLREEIR